MTPETRPPTRREAIDKLIARWRGLAAMWPGNDRSRVYSLCADELERDAADLLREEGEAQRSPCVHCGGPNAIVCNRCHSAVAYAPVRPRVDVREEGEPLKRYDLVTNYRCGSCIEEMEPSDDGEWVRYEQVADRLTSRVDPVPPPPHQDERWRTAALLKVRTRRAIVQRVAAGESVTDLAQEYGVPVAFVERISQPGYDLLSGE